MNKSHNYYRFMVEEGIFLGLKSVNKLLIIDSRWPDLLHQMTKVLRVTKGDQLLLMPINSHSFSNSIYTFVVEAVEKKSLALALQKKQLIRDPLDKALGLALALPNKPAKLEEILMHCTELGTTHFSIFNGDRSNYAHRLAQPRLENIVREAVEQSERARLPIIIQYKNLDQYLENLQRPCLVALERGREQPFLLELRIDSGCDLLIGPEGGFSDREIDLIKSYQLRTYSLGSQILRNETAAIVSTGIVSQKMQQ